MNHRQDEPTLLELALSAEAGRVCLERVREALFNDLKQSRFRHARAVDAYTGGIDAAVRAYLQDSPLRRIVYRNYLIGPGRCRRAQLLADAFMQATGATDQAIPRPHRLFHWPVPAGT